MIIEMSEKRNSRKPKTVETASSLGQKPPAKTLNLFLAVFISNICVFCFGTTVGWANPAEIVVLTSQAYKFKPTKGQWNWMCSLLPVGVAVWCLPMGALMKYRGCKPLMIFQIFPYSCGWLLIIYAKNIYMLFVGRFLQGMCGAAVCLSIPVYLDEISHWQYRGYIGTFYFGAFIYGIIFENLMIGNIRMQTVCIINLGFIPLFALLKIIPESPVRYIYNGEMNKARTALRWLRSKNYDVEEELVILSQLIEDNGMSSVGLSSVYHHQSSVRSVARSVVLMSLHQAGGGVVIIYYIDNILQDLTEGHQMTTFLCVCFFMFLGHLICVLFVERIGRRPLLLISAVIMLLCSVYLCCWFKWYVSSGWQPVTRIIMCIFVAGYCLGLGPIACLLNVELIMAQARHYGCAIPNGFSWLVVAVIGGCFTFPVYHYVIFYFLIVVCLIVLLFTIIFVPETKGLSPVTVKRSLAPNFDRFSSSTDSST